MITGELLHPGGARHDCDPPSLPLSFHHGAIWRCVCRRRWRLHVEILGLHARRGQWRRYRLPWVAPAVGDD